MSQIYGRFYQSGASLPSALGLEHVRFAAYYEYACITLIYDMYCRPLILYSDPRMTACICILKG